MLRENYFYCNFDKPTPPIGSLKAGGAATAAGGQTDNFLLNGVVFEVYQIAAETLLAPVRVYGGTAGTNGLDVSGDVTSGDGREFVPGGILACSPYAFTIGTSPAFFTKLNLTVGTVGTLSECLVGFRLASQAYQATVAAYTDYAALNINNGAIYIVNEQDGDGTAPLDTTDTCVDTATKTLTVKVSAAGAVTYQINGAAPTVTAAFTFDDGDVVVPFFRHLQDATAADADLVLHYWECGYQE